MKISTKINLSFLLTILVLMIVGMAVSFVKTRNDLKKAIFDHLITTAQSRANHIETFLELQKEAVKQLSTSVVLKRVLLTKKNDKKYKHYLKEAMERLRNTTKRRKYIYDIFLLNKKGIVVASTTKKDLGEDRKNNPCFLKTKQNVFIKDAWFHHGKKVPVLAFSTSVLDKKGNSLGIIVMKILMKGMDEITTDRIGLGKTGEIYLVNKNGYMITPSRFKKDTFLKLKVDTKQIRKCFEDIKKFVAKEHKHEPFVYRGYRGVKVLGVHDHIRPMNWCLIAEIDKEEAMVSIYEHGLFLLAMALVVLIGAGLCGTFISGLITRPVHTLHKGTEIIGKGNLDYKVATKAKDEIGQLSRAFDRMTQDLKKTTTSIMNLNSEIARRKQIEEKLRLFSHSVESAMVGIAMGDLEGRITYINESFVKIFGYSREDVIGKRIAFLYPEDQLPKLQEALMETMKGGWKGELLGKRKNGECFPIEICSSIVKDDTGRIIAQMASHMDITERVQKQKALRTSEEKYRRLFEQSNDAVFIHTGRGEILDVNKRACEMMGYDRDHLLKLSISLLHPEDEVPVSKKAFHVIEEKKSVRFESRFKRADGKIIDVDISGRFIDKEKGLIQGIVRDITQSKLAEEKMKEGIKIKTEFISVVSHELRTPLLAIKEGIAIVLDGLVGEINSEQKDFLETAGRNVDRLHRLINEVLDFSKLESRKAKFRMRENDINQAIKEIVKAQELVGKEKGLYIKLYLSDDIGKIKFDLDKINQVVTNLMNNAIKYTQKGGITVRSIRDEQEKAIKVSVKDTGEGIKEGDVTKLFHEFQQLGEDNYKKPGSTGLGLAICREIVEGHRGKIWVESKYGIGSEFIFTIPIM